MLRKTPFRPNNEVCQSYGDGVAGLYAAADAAPAGRQPVVEVTFIRQLRYATGVLGINRIYLARQQDREIRKMIRIPKSPISVLDLIRDHDGTWYEIETIQDAQGVYPPSLDVALKVPTKEVRRRAEMV